MALLIVDRGKFMRHIFGAAMFCLIAPAALAAADAETSKVMESIRAEAARTIPGANQLSFTVTTLKLPRHERDLGTVCGEVLQLDGKPKVGFEYKSYTAALLARNGTIEAALVTPFPWDVRELKEQGRCPTE